MALKDQRQSAGVILSNYINGLFSSSSHPACYPDHSRQDQVILAVTEAWNWLEVQGLLIPALDINGQTGWRVFSRRAERMVDQSDVRQFAQSRIIRREKLHPRIAQKVWSAFIRGEFDVAVFQAMKAVEISVREAAGLPQSVLGVPLMRTAFDTKSGALTDQEAEAGEREARAHLFAAAIGSYKNAQSHRDVNIQDPDEAYEIVMLANHLLRIVDQRVRAK